MKNKREYKGTGIYDNMPTNFTVIDIETTGLSFEYDEIIELGAIKYKDDKEIDRFQSYIKPTNELSNFITNLTGITQKDVEHAPKIQDALSDFLLFIGRDILIGHNIARFDLNFLYDTTMKLFNKPVINNYIDTFTLARRDIYPIENYKLKTIANFLEIETTGEHNVIDDCLTTYQCYKILKTYKSKKFEKICANLDKNEKYLNKKICMKGYFKELEFEDVEMFVSKLGGKLYYNFQRYTNFIILSNHLYEKYLTFDCDFIDNSAYYSEYNTNTLLYKIKSYEQTTGITVVSEDEFYKDIGLSKRQKRYKYIKNVKAKDIIGDDNKHDPNNLIYNKVCVITGKLERMERKEAMQLIADIGGINANSVTKQTHYLILGNNDYCTSIKGNKSNKQKKAETLKLQGQDIEIIPENVFYELINSKVEEC